MDELTSARGTAIPGVRQIILLFYIFLSPPIQLLHKSMLMFSTSPLCVVLFFLSLLCWVQNLKQNVGQQSVPSYQLETAVFFCPQSERRSAISAFVLILLLVALWLLSPLSFTSLKKIICLTVSFHWSMMMMITPQLNIYTLSSLKEYIVKRNRPVQPKRIICHYMFNLTSFQNVSVT